MLLWYESINSAKLNLGLVYYGRGYTLADPSCNRVTCAWSSVSRALPCTNCGSVASLQEMELLVPQLGVRLQQLAADMKKQLTWGDQWIGYEDMETIAMKKHWASLRCFGGTMI
jgi:chitinase